MRLLFPSCPSFKSCTAFALSLFALRAAPALYAHAAAVASVAVETHDAVAVAAAHHKVLPEHDSVRVLETRVRPS